jgi:hypothetical protein
MVIARVTWLAGSGTSSSPGSVMRRSSSVAPQLSCHGFKRVR